MCHLAEIGACKCCELIREKKAVLAFWLSRLFKWHNPSCKEEQLALSEKPFFSMPVLIQLLFRKAKTVPLSFGVQILYKSMGSNESAHYLPVIHFHQRPNAWYNPWLQFSWAEVIFDGIIVSSLLNHCKHHVVKEKVFDGPWEHWSDPCWYLAMRFLWWYIHCQIGGAQC